MTNILSHDQDCFLSWEARSPGSEVGQAIIAEGRGKDEIALSTHSIGEEEEALASTDVLDGAPLEKGEAEGPVST